MKPTQRGNDPSSLFVGDWITIPDDQVKAVEIWVRRDGTGYINIPYQSTYLTLLNAPGSALNVAATFIANSRGFRVMGSNITSSGRGTFGTFENLLSLVDSM